MSPAPKVIRLPFPRSRQSRRLLALLVVLAAAIPGVAWSTTATTDSSSAYQLWSNRVVPKKQNAAVDGIFELGTRFSSRSTGVVTHLRFFKSSRNTGQHVGTLWSGSGEALASVTFTGESASGWQQVALAHPVSIAADRSYVVSYSSHGHFAYDKSYFANGRARVSGPLTATEGLYAGGRGFPVATRHDANFYVDLVFTPTRTPAPPTSTSTTTAGPTSTTTTAPTTTTTTRPPTTTSSTTTRPPSSSSSTTSSAPPPPSSSSSPPPGGSGCSAFPDSSCTGWRHTGVSLHRVAAGQSGPGWHIERDTFYITSNNAVIDSLDIPFCVKVMAYNVTIKRSRISCASYYTVNTADPPTWYTGLAMTDVEIDGLRSLENPGVAVMSTDGSVFTRVDAHGFGSSGPRMGSNTTLQDSYVHDFVCAPGEHSAGTSANDGGTNIKLLRNNLDIDTTDCATAAAEIAEDFGTYDGVLISGNLFNGGGYCLYTAQYLGHSSNIRVENNTFGREYNPECGFYGPVAQVATSRGNTFTGNVWGGGRAADGRHQIGDPVRG